MRKICASLSLCLLTACATTQEPAVPPTAVEALRYRN